MSDLNRYTLKTITDLLTIPEDRFDDFLTDLKKWHKAARATLNLINTVADATGEKQPENPISMTWIDDGKHDGKVIITTTPKLSGMEQKIVREEDHHE